MLYLLLSFGDWACAWGSQVSLWFDNGYLPVLLPGNSRSSVVPRNDYPARLSCLDAVAMIKTAAGRFDRPPPVDVSPISVYTLSMLARVYSCAVIGLDGVVVEVEVDYTSGFPGMTIVGLPDAAIQESRERVQAAVRNAGVPYPRKRLVVNLAPASVRKEGPAYDLPIALGVLIYTGMLPAGVAEGMLVVGELSLDGAVRHARGVLPMAATARQAGFKRIVVPESDAAEAALIPDLEVIPVASLAALYNHLAGRKPIPAYIRAPVEDAPLFTPTDFGEVKGQEHVKRALEVAASGGHNVIMVGPPGAGKTLLARALPGILPKMSIDESLDVTRIYSVADQLPPETPLLRNPSVPVAAPYHQPRRFGGWWQLATPGGNLPCPPWCSIFG